MSAILNTWNTRCFVYFGCVFYSIMVYDAQMIRLTAGNTRSELLLKCVAITLILIEKDFSCFFKILSNGGGPGTRVSVK